MTRASSRIHLNAGRALTRSAGVPLLHGNNVRILRDAEENYPTWMKAIESATEKIFFESYIIHEDEEGEAFAALLKAKARQGVRVRVLYDWVGALNATSNRFWNGMREAGIEVRCFNPPRWEVRLVGLDATTGR